MCTICLNPLDTKLATIKLSCKHSFHRECFDLWSAECDDKPISCPNCRCEVEDHQYYEDIIITNMALIYCTLAFIYFHVVCYVLIKQLCLYIGL